MTSSTDSADADPRRRWQASAESVNLRLAVARRRDARFMTARIASFLAAGFCFVLTAVRSEEVWFLAGFMPGAAAFVALVILHGPTRRELRRLERLDAILHTKLQRMGTTARPPVDDRIARVAGALDAFDATPTLAATGDVELLDAHVVDDLALLDGRAHLLGLVDNGSSRLGRAVLATWLLRPTRVVDVIKARQDAARELLDERQLRHRLEQDLKRLGRRPTDEDLEFLASGSAALSAPLPMAILPWLSLLISASAIACFAAGFERLWSVAGVLALFQLVVFRRARARAAELRNSFLSLAPTFAALWSAATRLGDRRSPLLREIAADLDAVRRHRLLGERALSTSLSWLRAYRAGIVWVFVDYLVAWDLNFVRRPAAGFVAAGPLLRRGVAALARLEALLGLAAFAEETTDATWPQIATGQEPALLAEGLRHPLIPAARAIANDVALGSGAPRLLVVTGSNMAGKSTLLKALGSSVALAQLGAPVAARTFRLTPLLLSTDINVRDSLDDGQSYFAVEVTRVRTLLEDARRDPFHLALIDEIFRGTNTREKVAAGVEVARWLAEGRSLAVLATHDDEFTRLEAEIGADVVRNVHFSDDVVDGNMAFDYRLKSGPVRSSNAIRVLRQAGYPDELVERAMRRAATNE